MCGLSIQHLVYPSQQPVSPVLASPGITTWRCLQPHTHTHTHTHTHRQTHTPPSLSGSLQMIWVCFSPGSWVLESSVAVIRKLMWLSPCVAGLSVGRLVCPFCVTLVVSQQGDWGPYHTCHFPALCVSFGSLSASTHSWKDRALSPCFTKCPRARRTLGPAWPSGSGAWVSEGGWDGGPPRQAWRGPGWPLRCSGSADAVSSPCLEEMLTAHLWTGVRESAGPSAGHEADHNLHSSPICRDMGAAELQSWEK